MPFPLVECHTTLNESGDNATNIAEAAIYLMEGKNAKHIHNN